MAIRKSAPKKLAKKPARTDKKAVTKPKPVAARKTERTRSGGETKAKPRAAKPAAGKAERVKKAATSSRAASKSTPTAAAAAKTSSRAARPAATTGSVPGKTTARATTKAAPKKSAAPEKKTTAVPKTTSARRQKAPSEPGESAHPAAATRKERSTRAGPPRTVAVTVGSGIASKLGRKWNCFQCGSSFYDLNRPEPLCPKCGADQRQRPKVSAPAAAHTPAPRKQPRPMAPLLDDEDDGTVRYDEEFDLGVRTEIDDAEPDLFAPADAEEEDVFGADDE